MTEIILVYFLGVLIFTTYLEEIGDEDYRLDASLALFWPLVGPFAVIYNLHKLITGKNPNE